jgi:hypothetical protein
VRRMSMMEFWLGGKMPWVVTGRAAGHPRPINEAV